MAARRKGQQYRPDTMAAVGLATMAALLLAPPVFGDTPPRDGLSAYLAARAADAQGQGGAALADYRAALDAAPANPAVAIRAYREALAGGDLALARRAAAVLTRAGVAPMDAALFPLADAARADDLAAATTATAALATDRLALLVPSLRGWLARGRGEDGAAAIVAGTDPAGRRLATETRVLLLLADGRLDDGLAAVRALGTGATATRVAAAELLIGADKSAEARRLLGSDAFSLAAARAGATARPDLAWGVSRLLLRVADDLDGEDTSATAVALARAALVADPGFQRARLLLADQLGRGDDPARASAELDAVPSQGPLGAIVAARRVELLARQDRVPAALALARTLADAPDARPLDRARYADLLFGDGRPADALPWYARVLKSDGARDNWAAWLRYGGALDEAGRWRDAEKALRRALALAPDEPSVLNYLGYTLVDRGEDVAAGTAMLERAHRLAPDDSAIADSLGWAYFRRGDLGRALSLVEGAAVELPADAEVNDHLGDLYWALGRRFEARYAWRAALLTAEPRDRVAINAKLAR
ncbi:tetratricopeptide repeat protein [Sphingomonas rubra]|nr:tetratricopeptide repeat protein [Sphingomonas rubra]